LPDAVFQHLLTRARERQIASTQIIAFAAWLDTNPEVPTGDWFKRFSGMTVCGEGELVKTFLLPGQAPHGQEVI
jgi:hypothetical protein